MHRVVHAKAANAFAGTGSTVVFQLRAFMADRMGRPSWSASSVPRFVNPARSCLHRLTAEAANHVTLRGGTPNITKDGKEKTHIGTIIECYKDLVVEIPPADRQPGLSLLWSTPVQPATDKGVHQTENWLADQIEDQLWTTFASGHDSLPIPMQRITFEIAFLTRLQQRLVAARRSG